MSDNFPYADCDRWITGNWGNDAFRDEDEPEVEELEIVICQDCDKDTLAEYCREWKGQPICQACIKLNTVEVKQ